MPDTDIYIIYAMVGLIVFGIIISIIYKLQERRENRRRDQEREEHYKKHGSNYTLPKGFGTMPHGWKSDQPRKQKPSILQKILIILGIAQVKKPAIDKRVYPTKEEAETRLQNKDCLNCTNRIEEAQDRYIFCKKCSDTLPMEIQMRLIRLSGIKKGLYEV